jgi:hypothetical protein
MAITSSIDIGMFFTSLEGLMFYRDIGQLFRGGLPAM